MKGLYLFQRYIPFIDSISIFLYRQSHISPIFLCSFFLRSNGANLTENTCWKLNCANGGS